MDEHFLRTVQLLDRLTRGINGNCHQLRSHCSVNHAIHREVSELSVVAVADVSCGPDEVKCTCTVQQTELLAVNDKEVQTGLLERGEIPQNSTVVETDVIDSSYADILTSDATPNSVGSISRLHSEDVEALVLGESLAKVEQLWNDTKVEQERQALNRARKSHERWRREKKSLQQCIQESLMEYTELFEKAEAIRIQVCFRSPK